MQRVISHAKEWVWNGGNRAKNGTRFFDNSTVAGWNSTVFGRNGTVTRWNGIVVGGKGDE